MWWCWWRGPSEAVGTPGLAWSSPGGSRQNLLLRGQVGLGVKWAITGAALYTWVWSEDMGSPALGESRLLVGPRGLLCDRPVVPVSTVRASLCWGGRRVALHSSALDSWFLGLLLFPDPFSTFCFQTYGKLARIGQRVRPSIVFSECAYHLSVYF